MFQRIRDYQLVAGGGRVFRPRAYGDPDPPGGWAGWLVFFPLGGGTAIAPPGPETRQVSFATLQTWAAGVSLLYLEGALARALAIEHQSLVADRLAAAEYEALEDAIHLESEAKIERAAAEIDEIAAGEARADAEEIRRDRLAAERALAARDEAAATAAARLHEHAAHRERATAAAARRRARATQAADPRRPRAGAKKK